MLFLQIIVKSGQFDDFIVYDDSLLKMALLKQLNLSNLRCAVLKPQTSTKRVLRCLNYRDFCHWCQKLQLNLSDLIRDGLEGLGQRTKRRVQLMHVQVFLGYVN